MGFPVTPTPAPQTINTPTPDHTAFVYADDMLDATQTVSFTTWQGQLVVTMIPEWYVPTMKGAQALQSWLKTLGINTTVVMMWPEFQNQDGNRDQQSEQVPWLDDGRGAKENTGQLIWNFKALPYSSATYIAERAFQLDDTQ